MTPPPAAASRAATVRARAASPRAAKRPSLRVIDARPRRNGRVLRLVAVSLVVLALLSVVVAHSMLAEGQLRLTAAQSQMAAEEAIHRQLLTRVAEAENPAQIVAEAKSLNLVPPATVKQLPAVPLNVPIGQTTTSTTVPATGSSASSTAASTGR